VGVSAVIQPGHRMALQVGLGTTETGIGVGSSPVPVSLAPFANVQGEQVTVGGLLFTWKAHAAPYVSGSATASVGVGSFEQSTVPNTLNVVFGLNAMGADFMTWDFRFTPESLSLGSRAAWSGALAMLLASIVLFSTV